MTTVTNDYRSIAIEKQRQRLSKIPQEWLIDVKAYEQAANLLQVPVTCGILTAIECQITSDHDATALLEKIKTGAWSAEQVAIAFSKRAAIAHQLTNCLTEIFFDDAIERARKLDKEWRDCTDPKALRPLHGLPISLKDSFQVMGKDTSTGLACFVNEPAEQHSALAALLLDLGAILYCKTNLPQAIMTGDSDNNVFGRTLNPHNTGLTAGGSTGGEGALIALRGSLLGIGTDIGGSIRIPAMCNGIYGVRGSVGVVPHGGVRDLAVPGTDGVRSAAGPLATTIRDCQMFMKAVMESETWRYDSTAISVPWMHLKVWQRLRIGIVEDSGVCTPSPPVRRGLKKAAKLLEESGHIETVSLALPGVGDIYRDLMQYWAPLGAKHYSELFNRTGEPSVPSPDTVGLLSLEGTTLKGFFDLNVRRQEAAKKYLGLFNDNKIDAILMPVAPHTAVPLDKWVNASYTSLWNYLDYPAAVLPVDKVGEMDTVDDITNARYGSEDADLYGLYTGPELYKDAPIAVQLVGYRQLDEALLNAASVVDSIINGRNDWQGREKWKRCGEYTQSKSCLNCVAAYGESSVSR